MLINYFKLVRIHNLFIIALSQYLLRYAILLPFFNHDNIIPAFTDFDFALLVLSTLLIAAAGYAINDYFDLRVDRINIRDKVIVGRYISRRKVIFLHTILSIAGVLIGTYTAYRAGSIKLATINLFMATLLWLYSSRYKSYFIFGNVIIAFSSAMPVILVWLFERAALTSAGHVFKETLNMHLLQFFFWAYVIFAFIVSMIREIIKDIEDIEGDKKVGCTTMPIVIGIPKTKYVLVAFSAVFVAALAYLDYHTYQLYSMKFVFWYIIIAIIFPILFMVYIIVIAKKREDYSFSSLITKFIMLAGILSMVFID